MIEAEILSREGLQLLGAIFTQSLDGKSRSDETDRGTQLHVEVLSETSELKVGRGGEVNPMILQRALPAMMMSDGMGNVAAMVVHLIWSHDLVLCKTSRQSMYRVDLRTEVEKIEGWT